MSYPIQAERTDTNVPITLVESQGRTGLTVNVRIRDGSTIDSYLDFSDSTFKTAGWTSQTTLLTDLSAGFYGLSGGLDLSAITNLPTTTRILFLEFIISGAVAGTAIDVIQIRESVHDVPLDTLIRSLSEVEPSIVTNRSLAGMIQKHVNRVRINGTVLEVYLTDDATLSWTQVLSTNPNADPIVEVDTA